MTHSKLPALLDALKHPLLAEVDLSLERMRRFMTQLGNPQLRLPPVIHVAGTNGKGSLLAYLQAIFETAGYKAHKYTSPHLVRFNERIIIAGEEVADKELIPTLQRILDIAKEIPVTFFEATTAAAYCLFAEHKADVVLLETGMGGRLDATNIIEHPILTAITPVSLDHMEYLGNTLSEIANEKAGILKHGVLCVVGKQSFGALQVIQQKADRLNIPLRVYNESWHLKERYYHSKKLDMELFPSLLGQHQVENAAMAVACIEQLDEYTISKENIQQGLASARWVGRLQRLTDHPWNEWLPQGCELWLDGGHNVQGGEVLANWLSETPENRNILICGMMKDKDTKSYLKSLQSVTDKICTVTVPEEERAISAEELAKHASDLGMNAVAVASVGEALKQIHGLDKKCQKVIICGSLYLVGYVLSQI